MLESAVSLLVTFLGCALPAAVVLLTSSRPRAAAAGVSAGVTAMLATTWLLGFWVYRSVVAGVFAPTGPVDLDPSIEAPLILGLWALEVGGLLALVLAALLRAAVGASIGVGPALLLGWFLLLQLGVPLVSDAPLWGLTPRQALSVCLPGLVAGLFTMPFVRRHLSPYSWVLAWATGSILGHAAWSLLLSVHHPGSIAAYAPDVGRALVWFSLPATVIGQAVADRRSSRSEIGPITPRLDRRSV